MRSASPQLGCRHPEQARGVPGVGTDACVTVLGRDMRRGGRSRIPADHLLPVGDRLSARQRRRRLLNTRWELLALKIACGCRSDAQLQ